MRDNWQPGPRDVWPSCKLATQPGLRDAWRLLPYGEGQHTQQSWLAQNQGVSCAGQQIPTTHAWSGSKLPSNSSMLFLCLSKKPSADDCDAAYYTPNDGSSFRVGWSGAGHCVCGFYSDRSCGVYLSMQPCFSPHFGKKYHQEPKTRDIERHWWWDISIP